MNTVVQHFFDPQSFTLTYVVYDSKTRDAVVIDPVWNFDSASNTFSTRSFDEVADFLEKHSLQLHFVLETHAHADHISSSQLFKRKYPQCQIVISEQIRLVQEKFAPLYNKTSADCSRAFDVFVKDGTLLQAGSLKITVYETPGHTPACVSYLIEENLFCGDSLFMPDSGSGRCDFPGGSAQKLYSSVTTKIFTLPGSTRIFVGHDYQPQGRDLCFTTTVQEQKASNIHLKEGTSQEAFVEFREKRDATLSPPKLMGPALLYNINAGKAFPS